MKHDEFIEQVQHRAALLSRKEAEVVSSAVLETLAEWVLGNEATDTLAEWVLDNEPVDAAAQLPKGFAGYLEYTMSKNDEPFFIDEFFKSVSERAEISLSDAIFQSGVTLEVLQEAISQNEDEYMRSEFLQDYIALKK